MIRNAGGRDSDDAIRSLVISYKLLGTEEWFVIHHTDCGMECFTDEVMRGLLANSLETAALGPDGFTDLGEGPGSAEAAYIDWLTISDSHQSVVDDVARIRSHPLVPDGLPIYGYVYDVTGGCGAGFRTVNRPRRNRRAVMGGPGTGVRCPYKAVVGGSCPHPVGRFYRSRWGVALDWLAPPVAARMPVGPYQSRQRAVASSSGWRPVTSRRLRASS